MNKRIKEIEKQCWEPRQYGPAWFNSTKFAELIVQECANQVDWILAEGGKTQGDLIKQHFGVES